MSYIIVAEVDTDCEDNLHADQAKVLARILSERGRILCFSVRVEFGNERELTGALCQSLIAAGFLSFSIRHRY